MLIGLWGVSEDIEISEAVEAFVNSGRNSNRSYLCNNQMLVSKIE